VRWCALVCAGVRWCALVCKCRWFVVGLHVIQPTHNHLKINPKSVYIRCILLACGRLTRSRAETDDGGALVTVSNGSVWAEADDGGADLPSVPVGGDSNA